MHSLNRLLEFDTDLITPLFELYGHTSRKGSRHSQPPGTPDPTYAELTEHYGELTENYKLN